MIADSKRQITEIRKITSLYLVYLLLRRCITILQMCNLAVIWLSPNITYTDLCSQLRSETYQKNKSATTFV